MTDKVLRYAVTAVDLIKKQLIKDGWTAPPKVYPKPKQCYLITDSKGETETHTEASFEALVSSGVWARYRSPLAAQFHALIETGWCKLIPHDGSAECPCDPDARVLVKYQGECTLEVGGASVRPWGRVEEYCVILED